MPVYLPFQRHFAGCLGAFERAFVNGHDKIDINGHEKPAKPVI